MQLVILDDLFPYEISGFRRVEYEQLLEKFDNCIVVSSLSSLDGLGHNVARNEVISGYADSPYSHRVFFVDEFTPGNLSPFLEDKEVLVYTIFLNNAISLLPTLRLFGAPFAFTLYPGGGFRIAGKESDEKLRQLISSDLCAGIIVTQSPTLAYLKRKFRNFEGNLTHIYGGVLQHPSTFSIRRQDPTKEFINVLFIANRYEAKGLDKGLDIFLKAGDLMLRKLLKVKLHLVGPWKQEDLVGFNFSKEDICLHGLIPNSQLKEFLRDIDIAIFPTRKNLLGKGSFDGFPVGAAVESAMAGALVLTTNPQRAKSPLRPGADFIEISESPKKIARVVERLANNNRLLDTLRDRGSVSFRKIFSVEAQMSRRFEFIESLLNQKDR